MDGCGHKHAMAEEATKHKREHDTERQTRRYPGTAQPQPGSCQPVTLLHLSGSWAGWMEFEVDFFHKKNPAIMLVQNLGSSLITWLYDNYEYN